jgi:hypothetical protein
MTAAALPVAVRVAAGTRLLRWAVYVGLGLLFVLLALCMGVAIILSGGEANTDGLKAGAVPEDLVPAFLSASQTCGLSPAFLAADAKVESNFNAQAVSPAGAQGLMQFMPGTWRSYGMDASGDGLADPFNPVDAIYSAARMYCDERSQLLAAHTPGDLDSLMLAAYNAGIGVVLQCSCIPDYPETQSYVQKVLSVEVTMEASLPTGDSLPAPSDAASGAIAFAESKIGTPYEWGGDGSDGRFDCSGLTQAAYASVGIQLPRVANDQYNVGPHPTQAQLLPGDLVFFGTNLADSRSISHVGIYIGNGLMVDAPHTGAVVRIEAIAGWPDYFGATRPL